MSFQANQASKEKHTGFTFQGKEIILSKTMGPPMHGIATRPGWYPDEKRIEVVTLYAVLGTAVAVSELAGVPAPTISKWAREDWFKQLLEDIRNENDQIIDSKTTEIVTRSLDQIIDRIENGDYVVLKNGELVRKPVGAKDLSLVTAINIDKRQLLRGKPTSRQEQITNETVNKKLEDLAQSFRKIAARPIKELDIVDVEVIEDKEIKNASGSGT